MQVLYLLEIYKQFLLHISEGQQVSSLKALANKYIILITDSLSSARRIVDSLVHSKQAHLLAICSVLILFFSNSLSYRINCLSKVE